MAQKHLRSGKSARRYKIWMRRTLAQGRFLRWIGESEERRKAFRAANWTNGRQWHEWCALGKPGASDKKLEIQE